MKELSLQLYSVRNAFADTSKAEENFEQIAKMGYTGVEFAGFYGLPKEEMKKILDNTGLKAVSAHAGDICGKEEYYMDYLSYLGAKYIICPWADVDTSDKVKSLAEYVDEGMSKIGVEVKRREGESEGRWAVLDYGDCIVHIFDDENRLFYHLEKLWEDGDNFERIVDDEKN